MSSVIPTGLLLLFIVHGLVYLASGFRFSRFSTDKGDELVFGLPVLFFLFSILGSWMTVGPLGMISVGGPPLLAILAVAGKFQFRKPSFNASWHWAALICTLLFFFLKVSTLVIADTGSRISTFHDDYSYLQQINLLLSQKKESHFAELIRSAFHLESRYQIYHLAEFYFLLFFKIIAGVSTYDAFHFFLKPLLNTFAVLATLAYFRRENGNGNLSFSRIFLVVLLLFTTLRFTLADDLLSQIFPSPFWKSVFFQNYYFPGPLSYHVSYKISLAFLFLMPQMKHFERLLWYQHLALTAFASLVSVALMPFSLMLSGLRLFRTYPIPGLPEKLMWFSFFILPVAGFWLQKGHSFPVYAFRTFFGAFNLIFENYYWHLFYVSILVLAGTRNRLAWSAAVLLIAFPLVYLSPGFLFKIYAGCVFGFGGYFIVKNNPLLSRPVFSVFLPCLGILYFLIPLIPRSGTAIQVYSNLVFPILILAIGEFFFHFRPGIPTYLIPVVIAAIFLVNVPAIRYDNQTPLHSEKIPDQFFKDPVFKRKWVNILSISRYQVIPAIDQDQLGNGILDRVDNVAITMGGFEQFSGKDLEKFRSTGFESYFSRLPYSEFKQKINGSLSDFIKAHDVGIVLIEDLPELIPYLNSLTGIDRKRFYEPERKYWIVLVK